MITKQLNASKKSSFLEIVLEHFILKQYCKMVFQIFLCAF
jgi:hypothetical protein